MEDCWAKRSKKRMEKDMKRHSSKQLEVLKKTIFCNVPKVTKAKNSKVSARKTLQIISQVIRTASRLSWVQILLQTLASLNHPMTLQRPFV